MKRNILILFAVLSLIISLTGCGSSGHSNSVAPTPTTMTTLRVSLTQNGQPATGADAALYTPAAAMREGLIQAQNNTTSRASIVSNTTEGVYKPTSTSADGTYTFTVPAGEYTLIANKGTLRAVVTDIRAEMAEEQESITVEDLTPTAIIYGKVTIDENFGIEPTAVIVYLENTSCVALADTNGNFIISGVPAKKTFTLAAMSNQNGKVYTTNGISVEVKEDLSFTPESLELTLAEKTSPTDKYQITGLVKDASSIGVKDVLVMATNTNKSLLYVATTNEQGKFSIITNSTGEFNITVIGASPESVTVNVDSNPFQITNPFIIGFTSAYGSIKGKINNDTNSTPDVGRYLVQLIGVDGTPYRTQTKSDYDQNIKESIFTFDNVYPGTYTVFVDPAGNGFIGSVGTFTVKPGKTTDLTQTATATVIFVQPTFTATATSEISITEDYPFVVDPLTNNVVASVTVKDLNNNSFINKKFELKKSTDNNSKYIIMEISQQEGAVLSNPFVPAHNGKFEVIIQRHWTDSNTSLSGTLTGTYIVNYNSSPNMYLGDLKIDYRDKLNLDKDLNTIDLDKINNIKYEIIKSLGTRITAYDESKTLYCSKATDNFNFTDTIFKEDSNKTILDVSGLFALVKIIEEDNNSQRIICYKYETNNIPSSFMSEILDESSRIIDASIIANKYIAVLYDPTGDREYSIKLYSHTNEESGATITDTELDEDDVFSVGDYKPIGIKLAQKNDNPSEINSNDCYLVVLYIDAEEEGDYLIKIYDLSNNQVVAQSELDGFYIDSDISLFRKFTYLNSHNFYIETNSPNYPSFILNSNSIVEKSTLSGRESCFMDKNGYLYRYDKSTKSIIKTASLDGKPLDSTSYITIDGQTLELRGILGLVYPSGNNEPSIIAY